MPCQLRCSAFPSVGGRLTAATTVARMLGNVWGHVFPDMANPLARAGRNR